MDGGDLKGWERKEGGEERNSLCVIGKEVRTGWGGVEVMNDGTTIHFNGI